ncbi:ComF family protein [Ruania alba]|uniref:Predicted amidophosphoribosyltransferases n=1 Tax=Ruania alba TaxID=648782 RepID=A0A1H5NBJ4_9MICO|nr:phosphoribosyltransferase family protein [Ruania alba]SEE98935.1 Predicted amidophosphoribosyltransferases [Ruania alba]
MNGQTESGGTWRAGVLAAWRDLIGLVLPRHCAGCDAPDRSLCARCRRLLSGPPQRCEEDTVFLAAEEYLPALGLPTWSLAVYAGPVRRVVLAWKSGQRPDLDEELMRVARGGIVAVADTVVPARDADDGAEPALVVVPAPSGWRRRLRRRLVARTLAFGTAEGLTEASGRTVWVADLLRRRGRSGHALGARARRRAGRTATRCLGPIPPGTACLLVDDVVTSGATLDAARAALEHAGARVVGAVVLAATPPPGTTGSAVHLSQTLPVD